MHTPRSGSNRRALVRWVALAAASLTGLLATAADLDLTPFGGWPESSIGGTPLALANGRALVSGTHRGISSLLAVETGKPDPFRVLGSLSIPPSAG